MADVIQLDLGNIRSFLCVLLFPSYLSGNPGISIIYEPHPV